MEVRIKIRFKASSERFEDYGNHRYLMYLPFEEDSDSKAAIVAILSRKIGAPEKRILFKEKDVMGNWIFEVS